MRTALVLSDLEAPAALDMLAHAAALEADGLAVDVLVGSGETFDRRIGPLAAPILSATDLSPQLERGDPYGAVVAVDAGHAVATPRVVLHLENTPRPPDTLSLPGGVDLAWAARAEPFAPRGPRPRLLIQAGVDVTSTELSGLVLALRGAAEVEIWAAGRAAKSDEPACLADFTLPYVQAHQMAEVYAACDSVLPLGRAARSLSTVLLALACGCVPLLPATAGPHDALEEGVDHLAYLRATSVRLRAALRAILDEHDRFQAAGHAAAARHVWSEQTRPLTEMLRNLPTSRPSPREPKPETPGGWIEHTPQPPANLIVGRRLFGWIGRVGGGDVHSAELQVAGAITAVVADDPRPGVATALGVDGVYGFRVATPWPEGATGELAYVAKPGDPERRLPLGDGSGVSYSDGRVTFCIDETLMRLDPAADPRVAGLALDLEPDSLVELDGVLHRASRLECAPGRTIACRAADVLMAVTTYAKPAV